MSESVALHVADCVFPQSIIVMEGEGECKCECCIACS